jgi:uncharacterized protein YbjT (DUF2867 family)
MLRRILITGATGTVGQEVIAALRSATEIQVFAGVRDVRIDSMLLGGVNVRPVEFDFERNETFAGALEGCHTLFLLRPPQLADVKRTFAPLLDVAVRTGVKHIVFLSVQGAETSRFIPHHGIEALVRASGIAYTFLRPAYFMQNFSTTLRDDLVKRNRIFLPAGKAQFTLVDVRDIGRVAAAVLLHPEQHRNQAYALTSSERLNFDEMRSRLESGLGRPIAYVSPSLLLFAWVKWREGVSPTFIGVMILLHYLPRFAPPPPITDWVLRLTGRPPRLFEQYVMDSREQLGVAPSYTHSHFFGAEVTLPLGKINAASDFLEG